MMRFGAWLGTLGTLLVLATGTALAGNFGEVTFIDGADGPPNAGEERVIRFALLQHGIAPIDDGRVDLTLAHAATGQVLIVEAEPLGDGMWAASVTFPVEGDWRVGVTHQWFETSEPVTMAVGPVAAITFLPAMLAIGAFALAAAVIVGGMLRLRARSAPAGELIRAGG